MTSKTSKLFNEKKKDFGPGRLMMKLPSSCHFNGCPRADLDIITVIRWRLLCLHKDILFIILHSIAVLQLHELPLWIRACLKISNELLQLLSKLSKRNLDSEDIHIQMGAFCCISPVQWSSSGPKWTSIGQPCIHWA